MKLNEMRLHATILLIAGALAAAGCTASSQPPQSDQPSPASRTSLDARYARGRIHFRYPSDWTAHKAKEEYPGEFSTPMVTVSDQPLSDYCTGTPGTVSCHAMPVRSLDPGGVVLQWSEHGFPGWTFRSQHGRAITVDGRPAKIADQNAVCEAVGSDRSLSVIVKRPGIRDNWYQLDSCFREPGADSAISEVMALLKTVRISGH